MKNRQDNPKIRDNNSPKSREPYTNTSLVRSTNILLCLSKGINTNKEIAKFCKYSTSTVHRLLNVLKNLNWVVQDGINYKYYLGSVANQLVTNQVSAHQYLLINALPEMGHLSNFSTETVGLSVLVQLRTVLLHYIPSVQELKIVEADSGHGMQFATGATSKVLLSQLGEKEIEELFSNIDFFKLTGKTPAYRTSLMAQLMDIKRKGYGISRGERIVGGVCISAVVKNYSHPVALSILGPENRLETRIEEIKKELMASASRISNSLAKTARAVV